MQRQQEPVAIVGFACRLPGVNNSPERLWEFLERGGVASNQVPKSRFNFESHYDSSHKPGTMRPPGGMFLENIDLADFDASFFEISGADAVAMDPNQRQMLEVVFEGLENSGLTLERLSGAPVACFVGSFATDYGDMQNRDPLDRAANHVIGIGRASMANRLSYFLNIKGPSVTLDTACSGSMVGLHLAARALHNNEANAAIVATSNIYLNPEHVQDVGSLGQAHSPTGLCHTFDTSADGYIKSEAVSAIILKRLDDAIRDGDPIRAVIRGTASTSNGRTNGLASPSSEAQAAAIRQAYTSAGLSNFNNTAYLECHGTGTPAGDPTEVNGIGSVFSPSRSPDKPLIIGSIKSNLGHSEPAAGISGVIKAVLCLEKGLIPGTPTFINPNPKINFVRNKVRASRTAIPWPDEQGQIRRAGVNSFGYGGSNAHVIVEQVPSDLSVNHVSSYIVEKNTNFDEEYDMGDDIKPYILVLSANDATSLQKSIETICKHLINPRVRVDISDLAYTLSERRSRFWHRAFAIAQSAEHIEPIGFVISKKSVKAPRIGFIFTGQGSQWPQMGKALVQYFPSARAVFEELDNVLQSLPNPPHWSIVSEVTESRTTEHLQHPEFSQPLVTALQLAILDVLESWGIKATRVVGHSSGEIAAAYAAGFLSRANAIKAAFYRGLAAVKCRDNSIESKVGMLAVGLSVEAITEFLNPFAGSVWIACYNSARSLTISGKKEALVALAENIKASGYFARLLRDLAYHSELMGSIGEEYERLLADGNFSSADRLAQEVEMFSSVTASRMTIPTDALYWKKNMISPVRFDEALTALVSDSQKPDILIEIGPSGALAGPVSQVLKSASASGDVTYLASWSRDADAARSLFGVAGHLFNVGVPVDLVRVNGGYENVHVITDLPNYSWNHSIKYWFESAASIDWRFKPYVTHDLIGSKVLGSPWQAPSWRKRLNLVDVPWLRDHAMGPQVLMPAAGYVVMAVEAMYQKHCSNTEHAVKSPGDFAYRFRNVRFHRALVIEDNRPIPVLLSLTPVPGSISWNVFRVSTEVDGSVLHHCNGLVRVQEAVDEPLTASMLSPLKNPTPAELWYKALDEIGMKFGSAFQKIISIESASGQRSCRSRISLAPPNSKWEPQSYYPIHPAALDACFQSANPALVAGERSKVQDVLVPAVLDDILINKVPKALQEGLSIAESVFTERGRKDQPKSYFANIKICDPESGVLFVRARGLRVTKLDVDARPDPHTFHRVSWRPDISLLTQDQLVYLAPEDKATNTKLDLVIDLVAHKKPLLKVLEVNLDGKDTSSLWLQKTADAVARAAYSRYDFVSTNSKSLVSVQTQYESQRKTSFFLVDPNKDALGLPDEVTYDFVIIKTSETTGVIVEDVIGNLKSLLEPEAFTLIITLNDGNATIRQKDNLTPPFEDEIPTSSSLSEGPSTPYDESDENQTPGTLAGSSKSMFRVLKTSHDMSTTTHIRSCSTTHYFKKISSLFESIIEVNSPAEDGAAAILCKHIGCKEEELELSLDSGPRKLIVLRLDATTPKLAPSLQALLQALGWAVVQRSVRLPQSDHTADTTVLVLDELSKPLLTRIDGSQWDTLKALVSSGTPLLWVTKGSQHDRVTDPDRALVHGLFRVARRENPAARLTVLDVQSGTSPATAWAINQVLRLLYRGSNMVETEYAERDGILHAQRVIPDLVLNAFKRAETVGSEPIVKSFHETDVQVHIHGDRVGTLDLSWCEEELVEPEMKPDFIEVEAKTVGVNFKDVATIMGIVPENEFTIGCECAGLVRRVGSNVTKFRIGDRVAVMSKGTYANRIRVPAGRAHVIPSWMSFEDAATIPLVYMTSLYSLFHLGGLKKGQSVLIHSAAGGVGLAAIQLAQYKKAEIFVTVGTDEKREFLTNTFGIPPSHIFSSRTTRFAEQIMQVTNGRGIDIILNSLIGELLDASWRICADGGTMVEIGKRDIVDRNSLSMEPFDRNCSFRAVDLSYTKHFTSDASARLLDEVFDLVGGGHVKPIHPITTYGFDEVPSALATIRRGQHIGKIVITNGDQLDVQLPIRPALPSIQLDSHVTYLIVGGLKGLCGSLTIHMAYHGARHIIACSRSGLGDEVSAAIVDSCGALGCKITEARGDVSDGEFVQHMFKSAHPRIAGLIQGAMVLRDRPYETMTVEEYHAAIKAKVQGTWNLHHASQKVGAQKQPLDFFTMLSSVSGVIGNKGQANYAAGNTFLDAFASYRKSLGLAANTVDLGAIHDVGYVAGSSLESRFDSRQWTPINEGMLRRILTYSILQQNWQHSINHDSSAQLITGIAYPLHASSSDLDDEPRFGYLFSGSNDDGDVAHGGGKDPTDQDARAFRMMVQHSIEGGATDEASLTKTAAALLSTQITKLLHLETEVEAGKPLAAYGLDSLSAVEMRGWVRNKLGAELSTLDIMNTGSIFSLCEKIVVKLLTRPV
ncbi:hypothetical protein F5Y10DRAFT_287542 [Nemania abortiva]|nr:hypothetical protein F5Y10DRAFT_287542 [Nemania abortiva]